MEKEMRLLALPIAFAGCFFATPASADALYDGCVDAAKTNADFSECGSAMLERREAELNKVWKDLIAGTSMPRTREALLAEQRAWIPYKDRSCAIWQTGDFGREGQAIHFYTCRELVLEQRINFLRSLGDEEGPEE
jgi:uncharacterized protein YecT (DUF1311 family)